MKIFFVGIHNKPNTLPLDSSTKSGKLIDQIITNLKGNLCVKSNLFDLEYIPKEGIEKHKLVWIEKYKPSEKDAIVLLGGKVHKFFPQTSSKVIKIKHPSSVWSKVSQEEYVKDVLTKIRN